MMLYVPGVRLGLYYMPQASNGRQGTKVKKCCERSIEPCQDFVLDHETKDERTTPFVLAWTSRRHDGYPTLSLNLSLHEARFKQASSPHRCWNTQSVKDDKTVNTAAALVNMIEQKTSPHFLQESFRCTMGELSAVLPGVRGPDGSEMDAVLQLNTSPE